MRWALLKTFLLGHKVAVLIIATVIISGFGAAAYYSQVGSKPASPQQTAASSGTPAPVESQNTAPASANDAGGSSSDSLTKPTLTTGQSPSSAASPGDSEAPSVPQSLIVVLSQYGFGSPSAYVVSWQPSTDNVKVVGYRLYRQKVGIDFTTNQYDKVLESYHPVQTIDDGSHDTTDYLGCGYIYDYKVMAYDQAGNESAFSNVGEADATSCYAG